MTPLAALIAGLTTGGLTCLAVQGGLLLGILAKRDPTDAGRRRWSNVIASISAFLIAKIIAHTLLGFGLGLLGSKLQLSLSVRLWLQVVAGLFIILSGIRIYFPHLMPWLTIHPPAGVRRLVRRSAHAETLFAPALLGFLTILIPCGTTQAMELAAITTGSPIQAALILLAFTLGTAPLFILVGILAKGTVMLQSKLKAVAATAVIVLGMYSINGALVAIDSPYSFQSEITAFRAAFGRADDATQTATASDRVTITVSSTGYNPSNVVVLAGQPVTLNLETQGELGCTSIFLLPKLNLTADLTTGNKTLVATFPTPGLYRYTCGMGMFSGTIEAV